MIESAWQAREVVSENQSLREVHEQQLRAESARYQAMHAELKGKYLAQHVAIYEGRLIDHDTDAMTLVRRVEKQHGQAPVFITQVDNKPIREFLVRRRKWREHSGIPKDFMFCGDMN
jgi:hypothetical protein